MKAFILSFFVMVLFMQSCKLKESCEVNNTGNICIKNETRASIDVYVGTNKEFSLTPNETKCVTKSVGTHRVICWQSNIDIYNENINVTECNDTQIVVEN